MGIIEQLNTEQLKLPLGFIKIVELVSYFEFLSGEFRSLH